MNLDFFRLIPSSISQNLGSSQIERSPEPNDIMDEEKNIKEYDHAMYSNFAIVYAVGIDISYRIISKPSSLSVLDFACGPGQNTICISKYLNCAKVTGLDLSEGMINAARKNAISENISHITNFILQDISEFEKKDVANWDLTTFYHAAHHMPSINKLKEVLLRMEEYTKTDGTVFIFDLVRLRTEKLNRNVVKILGQDYIKRNLINHYTDYENSMLASWTADELISTIPKDTNKSWFHLTTPFLPLFQMLIGLPKGRKDLFIRDGWTFNNHPLFMEYLPKWEEKMGKPWTKNMTTQAKIVWSLLPKLKQTKI